MSIKRKFLLFETLTVVLNLLFATLTISLILEDQTQTHLSDRVAKAKQDFVNSLNNINTDIHQSAMNYLIDEENSANFQFLFTNQEFQTSNSQSLTSLYYRIVKNITKSLHSHSTSNALDKLYLFNENHQLIATIDNEKQQVYYLRHQAGEHIKVNYAQQQWDEQTTNIGFSTNSKSGIEQHIKNHTAEHSSSYTVIKNALYFKSVRPVKYAEKNIFWLVTLRHISPATINDLSNNLGVKVLLSFDNKPLSNSILTISPAQLPKNPNASWTQQIDQHEYYLSKHQFNTDLGRAPINLFIAYSSQAIQQKNNSVILNTATYLIIIGFFTLIILNYLISKVIVQPIYKLKQKAHEIAHGNLNTNINIHGSDEIAAFASDLSQLRDAIKTKINELYTAQSTLEHTVEERTKALNIKTNEAVESLNKLKQTQAKLVELKKVERLGTLVAGIAHNMNTPIGVVITANSHLKDKISEIEATIEENELTKRRLISFLDFGIQSTTMIDKNIAQAAQLINNFKEIAVNKSDTTKTNFNLATLLSEVTNTFINQLTQRQIKVNISCSPNIELLSVKNIFKLMIEILIDNSLTHAFNQQDTGVISISVQLQQELINIIYADNGRGVPEDQIGHLFDPFYTEDLSVGTGLGLSVLHNNLVHVLDGNIHCKSQLNQGIRFEMTIPQ